MEHFCSFVSWPIYHQCKNYLCSEHYKTTILLRVQLRAWNCTMFTNHNNYQVTPQNKLQKNRMCSISILGRMKEILPNFQWNPPSKMQERGDQTLKTCCEGTLWVLRRVSFCGNSHIFQKRKSLWPPSSIPGIGRDMRPLSVLYQI